MANNIETIYNDLKLNFESAPEYTIDFYSRNSLTLNNIKTFTDKEELRLFIEIIWQYLNAVFRKDRFNEIVDFATRKLNLIDSEIIRLNATELKDDWYNGILHFKGMALYRLRDYKTATPIYKYLTKSDPRNDNFKNWLNYSMYGQRLWLANTINIISGALLLVYLFAKEYIENSGVRIAILLIAGIGLFGNWGYEYYIKRSFRKSTKTL